jgi:transcription antitermination factor NusG
VTGSLAAAWCVAVTARHGERIAEVALAARGYTAWVPLYTKRFRGHRFAFDNHHRIRSRIDTFGPRPLFPGYVFVSVPYGSDAPDIDTTRGVRHLVRHPPLGDIGHPKRIRQRIIDQLREICDAGLWEAEDGTLRPGMPERLSPGAVVRTPAGLIAQVLRLDDKGRADLIARLFGAEHLIRGVEAEGLEAIE